MSRKNHVTCLIQKNYLTRTTWHRIRSVPESATQDIGVCRSFVLPVIFRAHSKREAEQELLKIIAQARRRSGPLPDNPTFTELWKRFRTLKEPSWSTVARRSVVSVFEGESKRKRRPSVLSLIGHRRVAEITRSVAGMPEPDGSARRQLQRCEESPHIHQRRS